MWDPTVFRQSGVIKNRNYLVVSGIIIGSRECVNVVNTYAPNDPISRRHLWMEFCYLKGSLHGSWVFLGDFNEVRCSEERLNSEFNSVNSGLFNDLIRGAGLHEHNMGHTFTYMSDNGKKLSKLDRFLVCDGFLRRWPSATVVALSRYISDYCPIMLSVVAHDFGHIPFRLYNTWLDLLGFEEYVNGLCGSFVFHGAPDLALVTKLKFLKNRIKVWVANEKGKLDDAYEKKKVEVDHLEATTKIWSLLPTKLQQRLAGKAFILDYDRSKQLDVLDYSMTLYVGPGYMSIIWGDTLLPICRIMARS
ncbi:uncharacterized protein LOC110932744 [Helianthus annuus]|uniref:uncharacterized protein LOC110932744 n=1 Tax=Helianthus annuus TaxID=4232 RepID=UPI000B901899|nr:uncharacterized protein LOC110932744 [Helianthus annuus]